ncbi:MAG: GntR family transcriptional regulator, partial [Janthinobacterium lividum]
FGARRMLEGGVVRCLCDAYPTDGWSALIACVDAEDDARARGDETAALRLSGEFHLVMAELTGNPIATTMLRELVSRTVLAITVHQRADASNCRTHEHRRLIDLLRAGDAEGAGREMDEHLRALEQGLDLSPQPRGEASLRTVLQAALAAAPD